ncbi:MAG: hypothetical protein KJ630_17655 [Proteobacteria bacterium]|nr:hypothetical protein [Pseudomonadota bacterium]
MNAPFSFLGTSNIYIDLLTDEGAQTGLQLKGNCPNLAIKTDSERKELIGSGRDNFGQVIASVTIPKPASMSFSLNQVDQDMFAMAFFGTNSVLTQASGTLTDAPVVTIADRFVEIGKLMISSVVVENTGGTVTYVAGTDYEINTRMGMIMALSTGAIATAESVNISCSYAEVNGIKMSAMTKSNIRIRMVVDGTNFADGRNFRLTVHRARLAPSGDLAVQGDNFMEAKFEASLETPNGMSEPFDLLFLS